MYAQSNSIPHSVIARRVGTDGVWKRRSPKESRRCPKAVVPGVGCAEPVATPGDFARNGSAGGHICTERVADRELVLPCLLLGRREGNHGQEADEHAAQDSAKDNLEHFRLTAASLRSRG